MNFLKEIMSGLNDCERMIHNNRNIDNVKYELDRCCLLLLKTILDIEQSIQQWYVEVYKYLEQYYPMLLQYVENNFMYQDLSPTTLIRYEHSVNSYCRRIETSRKHNCKLLTIICYCNHYIKNRDMYIFPENIFTELKKNSQNPGMVNV